MSRILPSVLTALAVVLLPQWVAAEEGKRPDGPRPEMRHQRPSPEMMFKRLDANGDGVITPDEISAGMLEPLKQLLKRADRDGDKKVTLAELTEAMKQMPPPGPPRVGPTGPPPHRVDGRPEGRPMPSQGWRHEGGPSSRPHAWGGPNAGSKCKHDGKPHQAKGKHDGKHHGGKSCHHGKHHGGKSCHHGKHHHGKSAHHGKHHGGKSCHHGKHHHGKSAHHGKHHHGHQAKHGSKPSQHGATAGKGSCPKSGACPLAKKDGCPMAKKTESTAPVAKKHEVKVEVKVNVEKKAIEAKLASLEKEKAATIDSLQKAQQAASAKMRALNKQQAEILGSMQKEKAAEPKK